MTERFPRNNGTQAAIEAGIALAGPFDINGTPGLIVPPEARVSLHPELRESPQRIEQQVFARTLDGFLDYYARHALEESVIFADTEQHNLVAMIDYHRPDNTPAWCEHACVYPCPHSPEWESWYGAHGQKMTQQQFGLFIEDNLPDIIRPEGARMLEIATTLRARTSIDFGAAIRLDNGEMQMTYKEDIRGGAGRTGQIKIPETFKIGIPVHRAGPAYEIECRFRWRTKDAQLVLWFELVRPHKVLEHAIGAIVEQVRERIQSGQVIEACLP